MSQEILIVPCRQRVVVDRMRCQPPAYLHLTEIADLASFQQVIQRSFGRDGAVGLPGYKCTVQRPVRFFLLNPKIPQVCDRIEMMVFAGSQVFAGGFGAIGQVVRSAAYRQTQQRAPVCPCT